MRVRDVMTQDVETIPAGESAENALRRMRSLRVRHLIVMLGTETVGVVSEGDLDALGTSRRFQMVGDVMNSPAITVQPEMTIRQAANLLRGRTIGCLPVMERDRLVGILTTTDLLELLGRGAQRPVAASKRWILKGRGPRRKAVVVG